MRNYFRLCLLVLLTGGAFAYIGNSIPQISTTQGAIKEITSLSPGELVIAGRAIVEGKGGCLICHSIQEDPNARAPNLEAIVVRASTRQPGMSAAEHIVESLYDPDAFVVEGYAKNQMKSVNKKPIGLDDNEILAVISYLFSLNGEVDLQTLSVIQVAQKPRKSEKTMLVSVAGSLSSPAEEFKLAEGNSALGREIFEEEGCSTCHQTPGVEGEEDEEFAGPSLTNIADIQNTEYLFESIVEPSAVIAGGARSGYAEPDGRSKMPEFRDILTVGQVLDLVAFMETLKGTKD